MQQDQYEKLTAAAAQNDYLSIAVNADGVPVSSGFIPWVRTVSAFNMKPPTLTLAAADLQNDSVMELLGRCRVQGCYIYTSLPDYGFITYFPELRDLFIRCGGQVRDLSFVRRLPGLFLFYLEDAVLPDLRPLIDNCNEGDFGPGKCFGFYHCRVGDTSALRDVQFVLSELLVWPVPEDSAERWQSSVRPGVFRFHQPD